MRIVECGSRNKQQMTNNEVRVHSPQRCLRGVILNSFQDLSFLFLCLLLLSCLLGCQQVQKPELKGEGPLAVVVPRGSTAPEYHAPMERWRSIHMEAINQGDFTQRECVLCHNPKTGCNKCHQYIGAKEVSVPETSLYWPE